MKKVGFALILALLLAMLASPVLAAPTYQGGSGLHFGPYTLSAGDSVSGDLVVFGPVSLEENSHFNGDLVAFGYASIESGAKVIGDLVVMGEADIEGTVDGDIFVAGNIEVEEDAYVSGDISAVGDVDIADGAIVEGRLVPVDELDNFDWDIPVPGPFVAEPDVHIKTTTPWPFRVIGNMVRGFLSVFIMALIALVASSVWPEQVLRVGRVMEKEPMTSFGVGLLVYLVSGIALTILTITICLSPFALLGGLLLGAGVLFGIVGLGVILGERMMVSIFNQSKPTTTTAALVGTVTIALILAVARVFWPIRGILVFLFLPPVAGAVLLTRFGTMMYTAGGGSTVRPPAPTPAPQPPAPPAPVAEVVVEPKQVEAVQETENEENLEVESPVEEDDPSPFEEEEG